MFKVISAEIKKAVSRPGIYVLAVLLASVLLLGVFIYHPASSKISNVNFTQTADFYSRFDQFENEMKYLADQSIEKEVNNISLYSIYDSKTLEYIDYKTMTDRLIERIDGNGGTFETYYNCIATEAYDEYKEAKRVELLNSIELLNSTIKQGIDNAKNGAYTILSTEKNYSKYCEYYVRLKNAFSTSINNINSACKEYNDINDQFYSLIKNFKYPKLSTLFVTEYASNVEGSHLHIEKDRLTEIYLDIQQLKQAEINQPNEDNVNQLEILANKYNLCADTYVKLVQNNLLSNALATTSASEELNLMYIGKYSEYDVNSQLIKYQYLFKNNKNANDYANPLTIGSASKATADGFDYTYFVLRLFSFIIIIYAIMSACHSIAGEAQEGTLRYYALRPVSRTQIILGKLFATLILSIVMIIFSAIIALMVGGFVYGFNPQIILTIFNSSTAITIHPLAMIFIYVLSFILELIIYTSISLLLSTLFKSDLLAVVVMIMLYLINTLLPLFVSGANSWLGFYIFSHISLYSLFGSSLYAVSGDFFNLILGAKVYATTSLALTSIVIILIVSLSICIATKIFKHKEL